MDGFSKDREGLLAPSLTLPALSKVSPWQHPLSNLLTLGRTLIQGPHLEQQLLQDQLLLGDSQPPVSPSSDVLLLTVSPALSSLGFCIRGRGLP